MSCNFDGDLIGTSQWHLLLYELNILIHVPFYIMFTLCQRISVIVYIHMLGKCLWKDEHSYPGSRLMAHHPLKHPGPVTVYHDVTELLDLFIWNEGVICDYSCHLRSLHPLRNPCKMNFIRAILLNNRNNSNIINTSYCCHFQYIVPYILISEMK